MPKLESPIVIAGYPWPLSYKKGRPPEVRLGKLLYASEFDFVPDCPTMGGDSGAPYFDLGGRLIGMVDGSTLLYRFPVSPIPHSIWAVRGAAEPRSKRFAVDLNAWPEARKKKIQYARGELPESERAMKIHFSDLIPAEPTQRRNQDREAFRKASAAVTESVVKYSTAMRGLPLVPS